MCRMLAVVSRTSIPANLLLGFRSLAETGKSFRDFGCPQPNPKPGHPDGWGIACVGEAGEFYARGAGKASVDPKYEDAVRRLGRACTPPLLLLAHVRRASVRDSIQEQFAHPFRREVDGRVVFFGHNGEIDGFGLRAGRIDTQEIMDRFLAALGAEQRPLPEFKQAIATAKEGLDREWGRKVESYTFLMLDGDRLVAHRDARTCVPYYTLHVTETPDMHVVCSEVLGVLPGRWRMLRNGEFLEIRRPG
jgi:predicted glutamine amidotransferase